MGFQITPAVVLMGLVWVALRITVNRIQSANLTTRTKVYSGVIGFSAMAFLTAIAWLATQALSSSAF